MDPVRHGRRLIEPAAADRIEATERAEVEAAIAVARDAVGRRATFGADGGGTR
jgi:hypothetical protein